MQDITVYTSIVGLRGSLTEGQNTDGAQFLAFVDRPWQSQIWREVPAFDRFRSPQRNALAPKISAHHFIDTAYSLWLEANVTLHVPAPWLVTDWLAGYDIAVLAHPKRDCVYEEAVACVLQGAANQIVVAEQMARYRASGLAEHSGLPATYIVLRRHSTNVSLFNSIWWSEYTRFAAHDQLSFMFAAREAHIKVNFIRMGQHEKDWVEIAPRKGYVEPTQQAY